MRDKLEVNDRHFNTNGHIHQANAPRNAYRKNLSREIPPRVPIPVYY